MSDAQREARVLVAERNLARAAFQHLTADAFMTLPFEALGPTKALLKRFFSYEPWGPDDDRALADAVGAGEGWWTRALDAELTLEYGWHAGRFTVRVSDGSNGGAAPAAGDDGLSGTFDGPVVPEATPNPRTVRFHFNETRLHDGASRWYPSAPSAHDDPGAARLFAQFPEVASVLVGQDFVAVSLHRPADWERLLVPVLASVVDGFTTLPTAAPPADAEPRRRPPPVPGKRSGRVDTAWRELGSLHPADPADLAVVEAAASGEDPFRRQVAANLLREAHGAVAARHWATLVTDSARSVRRATVDAIVDAGREDLRHLLETALRDSDPWVRWKALRGLSELGPQASGEVIAAHADDPDFRVRLEAAAALRIAG